jgi:cytochrome c2
VTVDYRRNEKIFMASAESFDWQSGPIPHPQRLSRAFSVVIAALSLCGASTAFADGDASAGKALFELQCAACHTAEPNDNGGVQGPSLIGVFGRPVGGDKEFSYTTELRASKLIWDAQTLDRFLATPDKLVPGTAMVVALPNQVDRDNLIAYLRATLARSPSSSPPTSSLP